MSTSRLEKFIYAICSMDVTDLPTPLSRIEKLWNCLITGETPDFEPLSRNEKYLMAMLNYYDINDLPTPISRGEKLLYKIVVGDTDLSDVPGYLSRYEELLKNLIENGGIGGGDFEYVLYTINKSLYTLYETAKKPVKSAILSGCTLVNYSLFKTKEIKTVAVISSNNIASNTKYLVKFKYTATVTGSFNGNIAEYKNDIFKKNTTINFSQQNGTIISVVQTGDDVNNFRLQNATGGELNVDNVLIIPYQEGMENWDIPYFEGMQSVRMPVLTTTGKNLFDGELKAVNLTDAGVEQNSKQLATTANFIKVSPKMTFSSHDLIGGDVVVINRFNEYDENKNFIRRKVVSLTNPCTYTPTDENVKYVSITFRTPTLKDISLDEFKEIRIQIEEGSTPTSYEPYKTNILTVNEDITLRGIGNVKDELNLLTGELTENIGEMIINGNETYYNGANTSNYYIYFRFPYHHNNKPLISDKLPIVFNTLSKGCLSIYSYDWGDAICYTPVNATNKNDAILELKSYGDIRVQYVKKEKSIKTVDLSVVDRDSNPTKLGTFENITHVSLESEGLIPTLEIEVGTIISEELTSASPLMDDISVEQQNLSETVDEQSDNIDVTMMATTEIYENTL